MRPSRMASAFSVSVVMNEAIAVHQVGLLGVVPYAARLKTNFTRPVAIAGPQFGRPFA